MGCTVWSYTYIHVYPWLIMQHCFVRVASCCPRKSPHPPRRPTLTSDMYLFFVFSRIYGSLLDFDPFLGFFLRRAAKTTLTVKCSGPTCNFYTMTSGVPVHIVRLLEGFGSSATRLMIDSSISRDYFLSVFCPTFWVVPPRNFTSHVGFCEAKKGAYVLG